MGLVGVEYVVVHVMVNADGLAKSAYSLKTESLQFHLLRSGFD